MRQIVLAEHRLAFIAPRLEPAQVVFDALARVLVVADHRGLGTNVLFKPDRRLVAVAQVPECVHRARLVERETPDPLMLVGNGDVFGKDGAFDSLLEGFLGR